MKATGRTGGRMSEPEVKLCRCCNDREPAGYVVGIGMYLEDLCLYCWKRGGDAQGGHNQKHTNYKGAKS